MSGLKNDSTRTPAILGMTRDKDVAFHKSHDRGKRIPGWRSGSSQFPITPRSNRISNSSGGTAIEIKSTTEVDTTEYLTGTQPF